MEIISLKKMEIIKNREDTNSIRSPIFFPFIYLCGYKSSLYIQQKWQHNYKIKLNYLHGGIFTKQNMLQKF